MINVTRCLFLITLCACLGLEAHAQGVADETGRFSVHEWGLLYFPASAPAAPRLHSSAHHLARGQTTHRPGFGGKPLLFFHPEPGFNADAPLDVTITLKGGALREIWPTPKGGVQPKLKGAYTWHQLKIQPNTPCGGELAPPRDGPACMSIGPQGPAALVALGDLQCEAWEMSLYLPQLPHCLQTHDGIRAPVLVYNGALGQQRPIAALTPKGALRSQAKRPLRWVYLSVGVDIYRFDEVPPGGLAQIEAAQKKLTPADFIIDLLGALEAQGLTPLEAGAFIKAWSTPLKATPRGWSALGFLDPAEIEARAPLKIKPQPRAVTRVMAFMLEASPAQIEAARPKQIRLKLSVPKTKQTLDSKSIERAARKQISALRHCYARQGEASAAQEGRIMLKGLVDPMGRITAINVIENTTQDQRLHGCLSARLRRLKLPPPKGGAPAPFLLQIDSTLR
ncbi:AgmX/PglI C-terminal domain-containing protein [Myxococcota bacterium]|nr:AgmX/PglI C-terminal domain-containing protein [Myxococcota bacterium]MBU1432211.1 AgmX/PglI C-terminal domain-containing protein [Myxococcota bacterium]MBU1900418.1 AgmX/PglI C-terminal domain-containing protein [Myxococcota bacterium]